MTQMEAALIAAVTALTAAIVFLFHQFNARYFATENRLMACENDRTEMWKEIVLLKAVGCIAPNCLERKTLLPITLSPPGPPQKAQ